jgi:hypothetical protein
LEEHAACDLEDENMKDSSCENPKIQQKGKKDKSAIKT